MKKTRKPVRQLRPLPRDLRREVQQRTIAQLLLLGWSVERIARKMGCTGRTVRYAIDRPEFQQLFADLQREHYQRVDRKLGSLLHAACDSLERLLRHSDWKARDAALGHIFAIHGKYVSRYDVSGQVGVRREGQLVLPGEAMTDEVRDKALVATRDAPEVATR